MRGVAPMRNSSNWNLPSSDPEPWLSLALRVRATERFCGGSRVLGSFFRRFARCLGVPGYGSESSTECICAFLGHIKLSTRGFLLQVARLCTLYKDYFLLQGVSAQLKLFFCTPGLRSQYLLDGLCVKHVVYCNSHKVLCLHVHYHVRVVLPPYHAC